MAAIVSIEAEVLAPTPLAQVIVTVRDADGFEGVGEAWWGIPDRDRPGATAGPIAAVVTDILASRAVGREAGAIERIWFDLWDYGYRYGDQGILLMGLSGLDLALWDLAGRRFDAPVTALLGGPALDAIPAYASFPPLRSEELLASETERALSAGFKAVKLHEIDPALVASLRRRFGPDLAIMVDVNGHFDPLEAIAVGRELRDLGVIWFEEPVRPMRDTRALMRVRAASHIDLAAGENEYALGDFERLLQSGAISYVQPEITKIGGLTAAKRIGALAELHNTALCPHNFRLGPSLHASIHWAFTSPASRWIEVPWLPAGASFPFGSPLPGLVDGRVRPPRGPGLAL